MTIETKTERSELRGLVAAVYHMDLPNYSQDPIVQRRLGSMLGRIAEQAQAERARL